MSYECDFPIDRQLTVTMTERQGSETMSQSGKSVTFSFKQKCKPELSACD